MKTIQTLQLITQNIFYLIKYGIQIYEYFSIINNTLATIKHHLEHCYIVLLHIAFKMGILLYYTVVILKLFVHGLYAKKSLLSPVYILIVKIAYIQCNFRNRHIFLWKKKPNLLCMEASCLWQSCILYVNELNHRNKSCVWSYLHLHM